MEFSDLKGKVFSSISGCVDYSEQIIFIVSDDEQYKMYHDQDCCESVYVKDVDGDPNDLVGSPILMVEEVISSNPASSSEDTTWTFYKLATIKGYVTISWLGTSNGYYSTRVSFKRI